MASEWVTTKLKEDVKNRLMAFLKGKPISEGLTEIMDFFDLTGAKPSDIKTHPTLQLKEDIKRSVAVTRGAEVNILKKLDTLVGILQALTEQGGSPTAASVSLPAAAAEEEEGTVTGEMIQQVVAENERLGVQLQQSKEREGLLQAEIDKLKRTQATTASGNDGTRAKELFAWLKTNMKKTTFNDDYLLSASAWKGFQERFDKL